MKNLWLNTSDLFFDSIHRAKETLNVRRETVNHSIVRIRPIVLIVSFRLVELVRRSSFSVKAFFPPLSWLSTESTKYSSIPLTFVFTKHRSTIERTGEPTVTDSINLGSDKAIERQHWVIWRFLLIELNVTRHSQMNDEPKVQLNIFSFCFDREKIEFIAMKRSFAIPRKFRLFDWWSIESSRGKMLILYRHQDYSAGHNHRQNWWFQLVSRLHRRNDESDHHCRLKNIFDSEDVDESIELKRTLTSVFSSGLD